MIPFTVVVRDFYVTAIKLKWTNVEFDKVVKYSVTNTGFVQVIGGFLIGDL